MRRKPCNALLRFVSEQGGQIHGDPLGYKIKADDVAEAYKEIQRERLAELKAVQSPIQEIERESKRIALDDVREAMRYFTGTLADYSNHNQAKECAYLNNCYRTKLWKVNGRILKHYVGRVNGWFTGYSRKPIRLVLTAAVVCLIFAFMFKIAAWARPDDQEALVFSVEQNQAKEIGLHHYVYFSAVTLTTLGYGDLQPNHSGACSLWQAFMLFLCAFEAGVGYGILGLAVAVAAKYFDADPCPRIDRWLEKYEKDFGLPSFPQ